MPASVVRVLHDVVLRGAPPVAGPAPLQQSAHAGPVYFQTDVRFCVEQQEGGKRAIAPLTPFWTGGHSSISLQRHGRRGRASTRVIALAPVQMPVSLQI